MLVATLYLAYASHAAYAAAAPEQFRHSTWHLHDNAPADIWAMIQARNGYLLLGTGSGLYRFDGVEFQRFALPSGRLLPSNNITAMTQLPNGDIWLGYFSGGAGMIREGKLISYSTREGFPDAMVFNFSLASDGTLWAATTDGLARFAHGRWEVLDASWNYPAGPAIWSLGDRTGNLWVSTGKRLMLLREGSHQFVDTDIPAGRDSVLAQAPDGMLWLSDELHGTRALPGVTAEHPYLKESRVFPDATIAWAKRMLFDRAGHLWVTDASRGGVFEVTDPQAMEDGRALRPDDRDLVVGQKDGLTSDFAVPLLQDREGTIWVGTNLGLNSFHRDNVEVPKEINVGPPAHFGLGAGADGTAWIIDAGTLFRVDHGTPVAVMKGMPKFRSIQVGEHGVLWFGGSQSLSRLVDGVLAPLPSIDGGHPGYIRAMAEDRVDGLWVSFKGQEIQHFVDGQWLPLRMDPILAGSDATSIAVEPGGRVWFGYSGNRLALKDSSSMRLFTASDGLLVGNITMIDASTADVLIGGESGLARFKDGIIQSISSQKVTVLSGISGIVRSTNGDVWINGSQGVVHILASDLDAAFRNPDNRLQYDLYDYDAGLPGIAIQEAISNTAMADGDGRLWFSTNQGVASIDPAKLQVDKMPPPVDIRSLTALGRTWLTSSPIRLPKHTSSVQISYTALSFLIPSRVKFRYRLLGVDDQWRDAGNRREAFYTNLMPGRYHFQVIAANVDGVWNTQGAAIDFTIRPAFYQTTWFLLLCLVIFAGALLALFLLRLRQLTLVVHGRLHERHLERERIARELHDTLLQSVQGLMLRFQAAAEQLPPESTVRMTLEKALNRGDDALIEARDRVRDLRASTNDTSNLSRALAAAGEELAQDQSTDLRVMTEGASRGLNPIIRDEAYRIAREALTNALVHARASAIEVGISYDQDFLRVRIRDDGVGIDQELLDARGKPGHWGLAGMHERAERMGATLEIWGGDGVGCEVALRIPSAIAYCDSKQRYLNWVRRLVSGGRYG